MSHDMRYAAEIHQWPPDDPAKFWIAAVYRHGKCLDTYEAQYRSECEDWLRACHPGAEQVPAGWTPWRASR